MKQIAFQKMVEKKMFLLLSDDPLENVYSVYSMFRVKKPKIYIENKKMKSFVNKNK